MLKIVILIKRKAGLSRQQFIDHYEGSHAPLGRKHLGHLFRRYVRNYPRDAVPIEGALADGESFDCVTEIWLDDERALEEMLQIVGRPEVRAELAADEALFQDKSRSRFLVVDEVEG